MTYNSALLKSFLRSHPHDAARTLEKLPEAMTVSLLEEAEPNLSAQVFQYMLPAQALPILQLMNAATAAAIVDKMPVREALRLLRKLSIQQREALLIKLDIRKRLQFARQLRYPGNSVAALMNPQVFTLPYDITVGEALKRIERNKGLSECEFYIVDADYHLQGVAYTAALLTAGKNQRLGSLAKTDVPSLPAHATVSGVADMPEWFEYQKLPVVEKDGSLVGVLHHVDVQLAEGEEPGHQTGMGIAGLSLLELCWISLTELLNMILVRETTVRKRI